jgi:hypothetical protein
LVSSTADATTAPGTAGAEARGTITFGVASNACFGADQHDEKDEINEQQAQRDLHRGLLSSIFIILPQFFLVIFVFLQLSVVL